MRIAALVLVCFSAGACRQPDWPAVPATGFASEGTASDGDIDVIAAGIRDVLVAPYIEQGAAPRSSRLPFVVVDLTLRICAPPEFDYDCVPRRDVVAGLTLDRNRESFRITKTLGPGLQLAPGEEIIGRLRERGWRNRFATEYPAHRGPVFVTAPVYLDGGKALLYVLEYGLSAVWLELTFDGSRWTATRRLAGWQS